MTRTACPASSPTSGSRRSTYLDLTLGYTFKENLKIQLGVDNMTDEQPPLLYQNNVINANTDVSTYDLVGPFYRASIKYTF